MNIFLYFVCVKFCETKMAIYKVLLQFLWILSILMYTGANFSADEVYSILSAKMDVMQNEMSVLRRILISTKSDLATAKAKLVSTQTEVENLKADYGHVEKCKTVITSPVNKRLQTLNTTSIKSEEMNCCHIVKKAIRGMKEHQKQTKKDIENMMEHKFDALHGEIANKTKGLLSVENEMAQRKIGMTKFSSVVNVLSEDLTKITKHIGNELKNVKEEITNNKLDQVNLILKVAKALQDFRELSNNHKSLVETVKNQKSQVSRMIESELDKVEHCQSGEYLHHGGFPNSHRITFKKPFRNKPVFTLGASKLDFNAWTNLRIQYHVDELSSRHVKVRMNVWSGTIAHAAGFRWMACPT